MKKILAAALTLTLLLGVFAGFALHREGSAAALAETGTLVLSVNPEISVQYNKNGLVTKIEGLNDDGAAIVREYDDYIGKQCRDVVKELVGEINEAGYFVADVDGNHRNVTIRIEPGSVLPAPDFLRLITDDVQSAVAALRLASKVGTTDYGTTDYGATDYGTTDYGTTDYGTTDYGTTDYGATDYGTTDYGTTDYGTTDYGTTDYGTTDYGTTDYGTTDYGTTDYGTTDYGTTDYGTTDYDNSSDYGDDGDSGYGDSGYDD